MLFPPLLVRRYVVPAVTCCPALSCTSRYLLSGAMLYPLLPVVLRYVVPAVADALVAAPDVDAAVVTHVRVFATLVYVCVAP